MPDRTNRFNYTGRQRITRDDVRIRLMTDSSGPEVLIEHLNLEPYNLPAAALLILETRVGRQGYQRLELGTVTTHSLRRVIALEPYEYDAVTFTLKVVGTGGDDRGRLLAVADFLVPKSEQTSRSLLPIRPSDDLGQVLWRLEFVEESGPELLINSACGDWQGLARSTEFQSLVFPQVVKDIALWVAASSEVDEDDGSTLGKWRRLMESFGADFRDVPTPDDTDDLSVQLHHLEQWASAVAASIAFAQRPLERFVQLRMLDVS
jgi:hypothetical protein